MNSSTTGYRRPGAFSSSRPSSPGIFQVPPTERSESDESTSSPATRPQSREQSSPRPQPYARPPVYPNQNASSSTTAINNFSRPVFARQTSGEQQSSRHSGGEVRGHRRQHSQGFFEPSLPSASVSDQNVMANLSASQIAAQAAMQNRSHSRQRSQTIPSPQNSPPGTLVGRRKPPPIQTANAEGVRRPSGPQTPGGRQFYNGAVGGHSAAAATAANAAYPPKLSPGLTSYEMMPPPERPEHKLKSEKSKMKLFSKPKDKSSKEYDREKPLPSPNKIGSGGHGGLSKMVNPSVTSLADSMASGASSMYSVGTGNISTSTLVPAGRERLDDDKKHRHHFLSRQKNKLKDRIGDDHALPLSSASSNSRPLDPNAPSSLYSFAPASPATTSFTGLDLRHAGKAVRDKKKEEKSLPFAPKITDIDHINFSGGNGRSTPAPSLFGSSHSHADLPPGPTLQGFGLNNMRPEDAWDFLRAKLLIVFEGEELRIPVEDLNRLVTAHLQRCILKRNPTVIIEDLGSLLSTGFLSLDQTLRGILDQRIIPHLVEMWLFVFATILPYIQAVFLPLDLEFKGHGPLLSRKEAAEFWGANPLASTAQNSNSESPSATVAPDDLAFGTSFDVRRLLLLSYRDTIILPRYETLKATFSRLSLDSINASASPVANSFDTLTSASRDNAPRPGTAGSTSQLDPASASYNSQSSTLYDASNASRSRGNSNLSAPDIPNTTFSPTAASTSSAPSGNPGSFAPAPTARPSFNRNQTIVPDSSHVTETVGRMLQCVSVLASAQSGDESQAKMEDLARGLKLNWLGRGRVGRVRRGFVGGKGKGVVGGGLGLGSNL